MFAMRRRRLGRWLVVGMALILATTAVAAAAIGCGSSKQGSAAPEPAQERESGAATSTGSPSGPASDGDRPLSGADLAASGASKSNQGAHAKRKGPTGEDRPVGGSGDSGPDPHRTRSKARSVCPPGAKRAECADRIKTQARTEGSPSYPVSAPSDCLEAMSRAQCSEIVTAQKAAEEESGRSINPETCLQEYSREYCVDRLGEQFEQQRAGQ